eukprot:6189945-Pleurochrysis_carterae.AAC.1
MAQRHRLQRRRTGVRDAGGEERRHPAGCLARRRKVAGMLCGRAVFHRRGALSSDERMTLDKRFLVLKLSLKLPNGLPVLCGPETPGLFAEDEGDEELADEKEKCDGMEVDLSSAIPLASNTSGARSPLHTTDDATMRAWHTFSPDTRTRS